VEDTGIQFLNTPSHEQSFSASSKRTPGLSASSSRPVHHNNNHKPGPSRDKARSCYSGDKATKWHNLFNEHEGRDRGNPQHIHNAADEQKRHQYPTAADAISAMT
jgi:hypothetical protein